LSLLLVSSAAQAGNTARAVGDSSFTSDTTEAPAPRASSTAERAPAQQLSDTSSSTWSSDDGSSEVDTRWSVAPLLGFSTGGLSLGFGIRGGKTLSNRIYIGGTFVYNTGGSSTAYPYATYTGYPYYEPQYAGYAATTSWSTFYTGPEGGYDINVKHVLLRPYLGLGLAQTSVSYSTSAAVPTGVPGGVVVPATGSTSAGAFAFWPGFAVLYDIPHSSFFVGGDTRVLFTTGTALQGVAQGLAIGFFAQGGAKF
jgi:hypothetical protein